MRENKGYVGGAFFFLQFFFTLRDNVGEETKFPRTDETSGDEEDHEAEDAEPPCEIAAVDAGDADVHTEEAGDKVEWDQDGSQDCYSGEQRVGLVALGNVVDGDLSEVVGVTA